jgi:hypothetical protein
VPAGATGRGQYPPEDEDGGGGQLSPGPGPGVARGIPNNAPEAPEGYSADLPPPEPIPGSLEKDAGPVIDAFGGDLRFRVQGFGFPKP